MSVQTFTLGAIKMFRFAEGEISWTRSLGRPQRDRIAAESKRSRRSPELWSCPNVIFSAQVQVNPQKIVLPFWQNNSQKLLDTNTSALRVHQCLLHTSDNLVSKTSELVQQSNQIFRTSIIRIFSLSRLSSWSHYLRTFMFIFSIICTLDYPYY